jgi:hypothetical protein
MFWAHPGELVEGIVLLWTCRSYGSTAHKQALLDGQWQQYIVPGCCLVWFRLITGAFFESQSVHGGSRMGSQSGIPGRMSTNMPLLAVPQAVTGSRGHIVMLS